MAYQSREDKRKWDREDKRRKRDAARMGPLVSDSDFFPMVDEAGASPPPAMPSPSRPQAPPRASSEATTSFPQVDLAKVLEVLGDLRGEVCSPEVYDQQLYGFGTLAFTASAVALAQLTQRVMSGEVDLEPLDIKRLAEVGMMTRNLSIERQNSRNLAENRTAIVDKALQQRPDVILNLHAILEAGASEDLSREFKNPHEHESDDDEREPGSFSVSEALEGANL